MMTDSHDFPSHDYLEQKNTYIRVAQLYLSPESMKTGSGH